MTLANQQLTATDRAAAGPLPLPLLQLQRGMGKKAKKGKAAASASDDDGDIATTGGAQVEIDISDLEQRMNKALEWLQKEYGALQVGRASPTMLDGITVDLGQMGTQPLPTAAKVLTQGAQVLQVSVYDAAHVAAVVTAIENSGLQLAPQVAGKTVKLQIPRPTTETRTALVKKLKTLAEDSKKSMRALRQKVMQQCKKLQSKDEIKKMEKEVQAVTDQYTKLVDSSMEAKEKEVMQL